MSFLRRVADTVDEVTKISKIFNLFIVLCLCLLILWPTSWFVNFICCLILVARSAVRVFRHV